MSDRPVLTSEQVDRFGRDGFVLGGPLLPEDRVDELRDEIERVIAVKDRGDAAQPVRIVNLSRDDESPVWQIVNIWQASAAFERLVHEQAIARDIATLARASEVRLWHDQVQYKPAAKGGVNHWHQDLPYWPTLRGGNQVTAWVALDDADESNGCMSMVSGSHLWGSQIDFLHTVRGIERMPPEWQGRRIEVRTCPVAQGSVHYHHSLVWHGSTANASGRPRRAIALHFMDQDTRFAGRKGHPMEPFVHVAEGEPVHGDAFPQVWP